MWKSVLTRDMIERRNGRHQWTHGRLFTAVLCAASCVGWMLFPAIGGEAMEVTEAAEADTAETSEVSPRLERVRR